MKHTVDLIKLKNGAEGLVINIPNATVTSFDINFRAGEYLVEDNKWEVPHLMEHVLLGANELIPKARDFQAELEKNGAYSNAVTHAYDINYEAECADFEWDRVLDLLLIAISKPLFLKDEFKSEFSNVQEEMVARSNNHFRRLSLEMRQKFGLISKTDNERLQLMSNVTLDDIKDHYSRTHFSRNMRFVIAGNFNQTRKKALKTILESIEIEKGESRFILPTEIPSNLNNPIYIMNDSVENLYFYIDTFLLRRLSDSENDTLSLTNTMLTETLYSKIFGSAREKGLVYGMNSGFNYTKDATNWWVGAQVSDKNAKALLDIVLSELTKVFDGHISDEDIDSTKQYALGRFQRSAQTVGGTANYYSGRYFFDDKIEEQLKIPERIKAVKKQQMIEVVKAMFADNIWGFGALGNCGEEFTNELHLQISPLWAQPAIAASL